MRIPTSPRDAFPWLGAAIAVTMLAGCGNPQSASTPAAGAGPAGPTAEVSTAPAAAVEREPAAERAPEPRHGTKSAAGRRVASNEPSATPAADAGGMPEPSRAPARVPHQVCSDCGMIESITAVKVEGKGTGLGAVAGGVAGIVVGNQIGGGNGKTIAKIVGAAGGALLGNKIEKKVRGEMRYDVVVRMDSGAQQTVSLQNEPTQKVGDAVKVVDGTIVAK